MNQRHKFLFLECKVKRNSMTLVTKTRLGTSDAMLWHQRLGLLNQQDLSSIVIVGELEFCELCTASKMHEVALPKKTDSRGQRVFGDIQEPFEVPRIHGTRYAFSFMDDFSRLAVVK